MHRKFLVSAAVLAAMAVVVADDTGSGDVSPRLFALTIVQAKHKACEALEKKIGAPLRTEFAEKDVLFVTADMTTPASRHQARLLTQALGLESVFAKHNTAGTMVIVDLLGSARVITLKDDPAKLKAWVAKALEPQEEIEDADDDDEDKDDKDDDGCGDG